MKLQPTEFPDKDAKQWEMAMPPQCRFSIIVGTLLSKDSFRIPVSESCMILQMNAHLVMFTALHHRALSMRWQSWKTWRSWGLPLNPSLLGCCAWAAQPKPSNLAKGPQFPIRCQWVCFIHYSEKIIGPILLTRLSATPHRMWKCLRFKYFQLLKGRTCTNLWIHSLYYHHI